MPIEILMPALSPTMEEGKLAKWLVAEGDAVKPGDVIAEIETDKATMEVEAIDEGKVGKIFIPAGTEGVKVNTLIAVLLGEGETGVSLGAEIPAKAKAQPILADAAPVAQMAAVPASLVHGGPAANSAAGRVFASPLARRLAAAQGIDIARIPGSGPRGRIVKADVERVAKAGPSALLSGAAAQAITPLKPAGGAPAQNLAVQGGGLNVRPMSDEEIFAIYPQGSYDLVPLDNMRKTIAKRLTQAKVTIPHFYLSLDCELDGLLAARERMNQAAAKRKSDIKLSVNDFIIKAMGLALQKVPNANATWSEQGMLKHKSSDVAVAVAIEGGLFTPVIRGCEHKSLGDISTEMKDLAARARNKRLAPHEYQGGSTAISNLGMFGIRRFDAVINPPHATILSVGAGEQRPIVKSGQIVVANMMSVTLSCDHRVVDGALGAELLAAFKGYIEDPVTMLA